jgi:hypothetical protein
MVHRALAALALLTVCSCGGATDDQLRARAAFDMSCPRQQIELVRLDDRTTGVSGCGQKATYVESCGMIDGYGGKHDCTWVLNTDARRPASSE